MDVETNGGVGYVGEHGEYPRNGGCIGGVPKWGPKCPRCGARLADYRFSRPAYDHLAVCSRCGWLLFEFCDRCGRGFHHVPGGSNLPRHRRYACPYPPLWLRLWDRLLGLPTFTLARAHALWGEGALWKEDM